MTDTNRRTKTAGPRRESIHGSFPVPSSFPLHPGPPQRGSHLGRVHLKEGLVGRHRAGRVPRLVQDLGGELEGRGAAGSRGELREGPEGGERLRQRVALVEAVGALQAAEARRSESPARGGTERRKGGGGGGGGRWARHGGRGGAARIERRERPLYSGPLGSILPTLSFQEEPVFCQPAERQSVERPTVSRPFDRPPVLGRYLRGQFPQHHTADHTCFGIR